MICGLLFDMAMAPKLSVRRASLVRPGVAGAAGRRSVSGAQVGFGLAWLLKALVVRHTPPLAAVTKRRFGSVGSAAMAEMRPLVLVVGPMRMGAGPTETHPGVWPNLFRGIELDGTARSSHASRRRRARGGRRIVVGRRRRADGNH